MKQFLWILVFLAIGCSSSQFTLYTPATGGPAWKITVEKRPITNVFVCIINDAVVIEDSFALFSNNFEKDGVYEAKKVKMGGYRTPHTSTDDKGNLSTTYTYQIRVFVEDKEVTKFDF